MASLKTVTAEERSEPGLLFHRKTKIMVAAERARTAISLKKQNNGCSEVR